MQLRRKVVFGLLLALAAACESKPKKSHRPDKDEDEPRRPSRSASASSSASVVMSGSATASSVPSVVMPAETSSAYAAAPVPEGCGPYFKALDCIASKMPAEVGEQMRKSFDQMKEALRGVGAHAGPTCATALESMQPSLKEQGCLVGTEPTPTVSGVPSVATAPTTTALGERSPVPSSDEWGAVTREVAVSGSTKLSCETKQIREWIRISCRGRNDTGGEPLRVSVTKGSGRGDDFTFGSDGVISIVYRFFEGRDLEAQFDWTDKSRLLVANWPRGNPEPSVKGVFQ